MKRALVMTVALSSLLACQRDGEFPGPKPLASTTPTSTSTSTSTSTPTSTSTSTPTPTPTSTSTSARKPLRIEAAPDADIASFLRLERARAVRDGRAVLVEVGATWCKPCKTLKAAIARGELDSALEGITILAFDADVHGPRLDSLGYKSTFIPYFAIPKPDGNASDKQLDVKIPKDATGEQIGIAMEPLLRFTRGT